MPSRSATADRRPVLAAAHDQDRLGAEVGEVEVELVGAVGGVERRGGRAAGDRDEGRRHLRPVGQHDRHAVAAVRRQARPAAPRCRPSAVAARRGRAAAVGGERPPAPRSRPAAMRPITVLGQTTRTSRSPTPSICPCSTSPRLTGPTPAGRARHDDVARRQPEQAGEIADHLRHLPDHLVEVASLPPLAVDVQPDRALRADGRSRSAGTSGEHGADASKALPTSQGRPSPWPCPAGRGGSCRGRRRSRRRSRAPCPTGMSRAAALQRDHHLDLVMHVVGGRRDRGTPVQ